MEQFVVVWTGQFNAPSVEVAEKGLGDAMEHLLACGDVTDPTIGFDRETYAVEFEVIVDASDPLDCVCKASALIRSAIHGANIATPGWPTAAEIEDEMAMRFEQGPTFELLDA